MLKPPLIYAEYLRNIHSITVQVEFPISLSSTEPCSVEIRENGRVFAVCNGGREYALRLPATTVAKGPLLQPAVGQSGVSYRLPVAVAPSSDHRDGLQRSSLSASPDNFLPWCAPDLNSHEVIIHCRQCLSEIVPLGAVKKWKDLPSHNWAEMMDFWHCHKPHPTQGSSEPTCSHAGGEKWRGSGSVGNINGFTAQRQVGLVGIMALILARQDCVGVVVEVRIRCMGDIPDSRYTLYLPHSRVTRRCSVATKAFIPWLLHRYNYPRKNKPASQSTSLLSVLRLYILKLGFDGYLTADITTNDLWHLLDLDISLHSMRDLPACRI